MDKKIIKKYLNERFLSEGETPGIDLANKMKKEETKINKDGVKTIADDVTKYDKDIKKEDKDGIDPKKFNYNSDDEKQYHDEVEIRNGQEMIEFDREPNKEYKDKAKKAIIGDSTTGNKSDETDGSKFGKDFIKKTNDSKKKRDEVEITNIQLGNDMETLPKNKKSNKYLATENWSGPSDFISNIFKFFNVSDMRSIGKSEKWLQLPIKNYLTSNNLGDYVGYNLDKQNNLLNIIGKKGILSLKLDNNGELKPIKVSSIFENKTNNKNEIKPMKRIKFKEKFNGMDNALKLIPEHHKIDKNVFEMTDENETYKVRWEGTLNEGQAVVLLASSKTEINEDVQKMKKLFGYKSVNTLGNVKGEARIKENASFTSLLEKTKKLLAENEEETEDDDAPEVEDTYYKSDEEDSAPEDAPVVSDIDKDDSKPEDTESDGDDEIELPKAKPSAYKLMRSKSTGQHYIIKGNDIANGIPCPEKHVELAKKNPLLAIEKIESDKLNKSKGMSDETDEEGLDEGIFTKSKEELYDIGLKAIQNHPVRKKTYEDWMKKDPLTAEKYVIFVGKNPGAKYIGYDANKKEFNLTGKFLVASGEGTAGA